LKIQIREKPWDLVFIVVVTALLLAVIAFSPSSTARTILGLPYILFFPGYVLISFLFPEEQPLDKIERIALSFGLSIAITPLIGLLLNYIWEISLVPILYSQSLFIFAFSLLAYLRRETIPLEERFSIYIEINPPDWENYDIIDKALVIATVGLLIASGGLAYHIATTPRTGEQFTEYYVLGPNGDADEYPTNLTVNESGHVILGAVNREHKEMEYLMVVRMASTNLNSSQELDNKIKSKDKNETIEVKTYFDYQNMTVTQMSENYNITLSNSTTYIQNFSLKNDEKFSHHMNYTIQEPGLYMVQFLLVKPNEFSPQEKNGYRELHLWVTVREG